MPSPLPENYQYPPTLRSEISPLLPNKYSRILEIGCGYGSFRENFKEENEYWGVEPNSSATEVALTKLDHVLTGYYDEISDQLPDNYFDLVICNDVIEHMVDHENFLDSIKKKMVGNSYIVGAIPNVRHYQNLINLLVHKDWEYQEMGVLDKTHLRFFTKKSLIRLFKKHNYLIEEISGINSTFRRGFFPRNFAKLFLLIVGDDIKYSQFAFRIKPLP
jgi:2-polyprenyl-3-methyl-5-hydroxy-6-metoxy-1,4-benzoquinol methylase